MLQTAWFREINYKRNEKEGAEGGSRARVFAWARDSGIVESWVKKVDRDAAVVIWESTWRGRGSK